MKTLILNTYGGSLLVGAKMVGAEVVGSYEDVGFGQDIARANFPDVPMIAMLKDWPAQDLSETLVVAHPPCSAFSVQNCSPKARGADSDAFKCTIKVVGYAAENKALAICVESVMGALGGAWNNHQQLADDNGYDLYRVLENGAMYGCQWRERYWSVYVRKGATPSNVLKLVLQPKWQTVGEVVAGHEGGNSSGNQDVLLERQKAKLRDIAHLNDEEMAYLFDGTRNFGTRALGAVLFDYKYRTPTSTALDKWEMFKKYIGGFASGTMCYLDPNGLAPVLMGGSHWFLNGRNVSEEAFNCIGGFPADYKFPEAPRNYLRQQRMYLSKGVMPPVAAWIIEQVTAHLGETVPISYTDLSKPHYSLTCEPNHIADFRISKDAWKNRDVELPTLRGFDEQPPPPKAFVTRPAEPVDATAEPPAEKPAPAPKPPKAPKPQAQEGAPKPRTRGQVEAVPGAIIEDKRRLVIYQASTEQGVMSHDALVGVAAAKLNIEVKTAHWHIQQMKKVGWLRDVAM